MTAGERTLMMNLKFSGLILVLFQSPVLSFANVDAKNNVVVDALVNNLLYLAHQAAAVLVLLKSVSAYSRCS